MSGDVRAADDLRRIARELLRTADRVDRAGLSAAAERASIARLDDWSVALAAYRARRERAHFFPETLFGEPAWDMLLELFVAAGDRKQIATTSLCLGSGVPATTAQRYIDMLVARGMAERCVDPEDRRRTLIGITQAGRDAMTSYFRQLRDYEFGFSAELALLASARASRLP